MLRDDVPQTCFDENAALDYAEGLLGVAERHAVEAHAEGCGACRRVLSELAHASGRSGAAAAPSTSGAAASPGTRVGRYHVLKPLGAGAMGVVYLAYDPELDRRVALKVLASTTWPGDTLATRSLAASLHAEAQAMARVSHPNLVTVYDVGEWAGQVYLTMELVEGAPLSKWLRSRRRSWREVVGMFVAAGEGLAAAHRAGVAHGDFKPDNVFVDAGGWAKVGDFGLAIVGGGASGGARGTPAYMAPEQWGGEAADAKSDQFSFCVALSEALYGGRPRAGGEPDEGPPSAKGVASRGRVPGRVRAALRRGLCERPDGRHASMETLVRAVRPRRPGAVGLGVTAAAAAAATAAVMAMRPAPAKPCAQAERRLAGAWDETRRAAVREAMLASGAPYAGDVWRGVERRLDQYVAAWVGARTRVCLAEEAEGGASGARAGGPTPQAPARARAACLDDEALDLAALTRELVSADPQRLMFAPSGVEGLPSPADCEQREVRPRGEGAPADARQRERMAAVRRELAESGAAWAVGRFAEAHQQARAALAAARALGASELEAQALVLVSVQNVRLEAAPDVGGLLKEAYAAAEAAHLDDAKMSAAVGLTYHVGCQASDAGGALEWARLGFATHRRVGGGETQEANLHRATGNALQCAHRFGEAAQEYERAAEVFERLHPSSLLLGMTLLNLATARSDEGRFDLTAPLYDRAQAAVESAVGAAHPLLGALYDSRGSEAHERGEYESARPQLERAIELLQQGHQPTHSFLVGARNRLSLTLVRLGRAAEAAADQAALLECFRPERERPGPLAASVMTIAGVVAVETGRGAEGLELLRRAAAALSGGPPGPYTSYLPYAEAWRGRGELQAGRRADAVASFERALGLFEADHDPSPELPELQFSLARALDDAGRARALAARARDGFRAFPAAYGQRRAGDVEQWLAAQRGARVAAPRRRRPPRPPRAR